jgi:hypothetical protein
MEKAFYNVETISVGFKLFKAVFLKIKTFAYPFRDFGFIGVTPLNLTVLSA